VKQTIDSIDIQTEAGRKLYRPHVVPQRSRRLSLPRAASI